MNLIVRKNDDEIAKIVASDILHLVKEKPNAVLGLATGSSPVKTYGQIVERAKRENIDFSSVITFNLDEYLNNPDDKKSYRCFMDSHLFDLINIKKENTHFPSLETIHSYDEEIRKDGGIDLQLLGIGADGHIGFNEPGTPFDSLTHVANLTEKTIQDNSRFFSSVKDVPTRAVTRGRKTIRQAKKIILIATGKNKAFAIGKTFEKVDISTPASILNHHSNCTVFCDEEAASLIKHGQSLKTNGKI